MATYVYETIPTKRGEKPRHFEIKQSMKDAALTRHPETGEAIRRIVTTGAGLLTKDSSKGSSSSGSTGHQHSGGCGCGRNRCGS